MIYKPPSLIKTNRFPLTKCKGYFRICTKFKHLSYTCTFKTTRTLQYSTSMVLCSRAQVWSDYIRGRESALFVQTTNYTETCHEVVSKSIHFQQKVLRTCNEQKSLKNITYHATYSIKDQRRRHFWQFMLWNYAVMWC